jgi:hypothetical protein
MSLRVRRVGAVALFLALVACSSSSSSTPSGGPNPSSSVITVTTSTGSPLSDILVTLSTGITDGQPTGVITSQRTDASGVVTFYNLPSSGQLCVSAETTVGGHLYRTSHCASPFPARDTLAFPKGMP